MNLTSHSLSVPYSMDRIYPVEVKRSPLFFFKGRLTAKDYNDSVRTAQTTDQAFNMLRHHPETRSCCVF